ncbi:class D sortase [Sphingomonas sp.]|uniref:class D sortase n=1 Tax=Sphingomonas sp. TaxID=28214 RepID=UPI0028AD5074|nr:class D sortase [Sphingomonas sp.]
MRATALVLCLGGALSLAEGVAVPISAAAAQHRLQRVFEQRRDAASLARPRVASNAPSVAPGRSPRTAARTGVGGVATLPIGGPIARISVDRLGVRDIVLAGNGTHEQLAEGPTMIKQGDDASPVTILAAHRDTHFLFIRDLREGDDVRLEFVNGVVERYRITGFETVRWDRFSYPLHPAHPRLALTTCYPFGSTEYGGPLRRVAWAERR